MNSDDLSECLKALADPMRRALLARLPEGPDCEHGNNVSQLAADLAAPQPTISHHLKVLRQADLVDYRKMCRDVFYWKNSEKLASLAKSLGDSINFDLRTVSQPIGKQ